VKKNIYKEAGLKYHRLCGFNVLPVIAKAPNMKWEKWQTEIQTEKDIEEMNWNSSCDGVGAISGINNLRIIDIDGIKDWELLDLFLLKLKLGYEYLWLCRSGSGNGAHIIFYAEDDDRLFKILGSKKGVYKFKLKTEGLCDHIEIRWSDSQTVLPPSRHPSGGIYDFIYDEPKEKPSFIKTETLIEFAEEFILLNEKETKKEQQSNNNDYNTEDIEAAINILGKNLKENCYEEWMEIGFALASIGEDGRKYFIQLSQANEHYNDTEVGINKKFDSFLKDYDGRSTLGTLFYYAQRYGYKGTGDAKKVSFFHQAEKHLTKKYDFIFNTLKHKLYWKRKDENEFKEMKDRDLNSIFIELKGKKKISISYENLRRLLISDFVPRIDPLEEYFKNLPEWDGVDHIGQLSKTVTVEEGSEANWKVCLRKWLIATVAGALSNTMVNHTAIILQGIQGIGKTRWIQKLVPIKLLDYFFTGNITPNDKDSKLAVVKNFIINLDEMETLNRGDIGFLKSLMTQKDLELRKPYGVFEEQFKRRSSFIGSINKMEFLNDPTGSRRFLCFAVEKINYEHNINLDKVFAQALYLFNKGEKYWFDKAEIESITQNNMKFTFQPLEEQLILEKYEPCGKDDPDKLLMNASEIAKEIYGEKPYNNNTIRQIGMALNKYGFIKGNAYNGKHSIKKWIVKKIKTVVRFPDEI